LANGINPLDDMPIPENEIVNNVRISRCFFYVSNLLQREIEQGFRNQPKEKKSGRAPFSLTPEQLQQFEYSVQPITATAIGRKLNWIVREEIEAKKMKRFSNKKILYWLCSIGLIEWRGWEGK
jgi:hypothetical protein